MINALAWFKAHTADERGASMVEYALLVALIAIVAILAITATGDQVSQKFEQVQQELSNANP